jgi:pseudaminic acid cytidylyltransferase
MKIAIIPARGGSKRIPKKNIKYFFGKPIIAWSIEAAKECDCFDRIIVSTDDYEIASIAIKYGAEVPFMRSADLSDEYTGTNDVVKDVLHKLKTTSEQISYVCCIYATAPFLNPKYLIQSYNEMIYQKKSYSFSATSYSFPVERAFKIDQNNEIQTLFPEKIKSRSQDLKEVFHDAGQFYWGISDAFLNDMPIFSNDSIATILPKYLVQDIDTIEDWHQAELMFEAYLNKKDLKL